MSGFSPSGTAAAVLLSAAMGHTRAQEAVEYKWERMLPAGSGCWVDYADECGPNQWPIAHDPVSGPDGKLWMVGQGKGSAWVWSSADGTHWQKDRSDAGWGERYGMTVTYYRNRLWAMGGTQVTNDAFRNDVWTSLDGQHWKRVSEAAPWGPRRWHAVVVFRDEMWLVGGSNEEDLNDVWSTSDGQSWTRQVEAAPWPARGGHAAVVHGGRLWVIGGGGWTDPRNDVWSTSDGVAWTQVLAAAAWPGRVHFGVEALDGRLWILGGASRKDVWFSRDGKRWEPAETPPWGPRTANSTVVFAGSLWLFGGKTGTDEAVADEVWRMRRVQ